MADQLDYSLEDLEVLRLLRSITDVDASLVAPPESVWNAIATSCSAHDAEPFEPTETTVAGNVSSTRRNRWRLAVALGTAAAAAVVALALALPNRHDPAVAMAELSSKGLDGAPAGLQGDAFVRSTHGMLTLHVDLDGLRPTSGEYLEVWLIKPDISGMVSLGIVRPDGNYELPEGLNVKEFPIVDVSTEPYDGNPRHSGDSLLRGVLTT